MGAVVSVQLGELAALLFATPTFADHLPGDRLSLVLLHGFGVPGNDLSWLAERLIERQASRGRPFQVILPVGPLPLVAEAPNAGRTWFPVDMFALQVALLQRRWDELAEHCPEGLAWASHLLDEALLALQTLDVPPSDVVVGGFSQGALVGAQAVFSGGAPPRGLVLLSAMMTNEKEWLPLIARRAGLEVFQMHSPEDPVVPYALGQRLGDVMRKAGLHLTEFEAQPGHYIHLDAADALDAWLDQRFEV